MPQSEEGTMDIQGVTTPTTAVSETTKPSATPAATAIAGGNREMQERTSREHPTDKRFVQRHANAMKARAGHRRNIRRSNTNG